MVFLEAFLSLRWTKQENNHLRYFLNLFPRMYQNKDLQ